MADREILALFEALDRMGQGAFILSPEFEVDHMNATMTLLLGGRKKGKCHELLIRSKERCPRCNAERILAAGYTGSDRRVIHQPGAERDLEMTELPFQSSRGRTSLLCVLKDVTESSRTEKLLRMLEQDYTLLFEHVGSGVFIMSSEGSITSVNQSLLDMLGYQKRNEFLGIDAAKKMFRRIEDYRSVRKLMDLNEVLVDHEVDFKQKNGRPISVLLTLHSRCDMAGTVVGYEGIVSRRKRLLRELQEAHDFLRSIVQDSPNAIIGSDLRGQIILWNQGAEEILGYKASDVIGKMNVRELYPEGKAEEVFRLQRKLGGRLTGHPVVHVRRDGQRVEGTLSTSIISDVSGKNAAVVGIFVDLKERIQMERKLRQTQDQLLQSEKLAAMGRLTSQIAHELNNPLYGIMNTLELMKTEVDPQSRRRRLLDMALSEIVRLTDLLRKMLSFSKPDQDEKQPVDMNAILDEILLLYEKQLRENDIHLSHSFGDDLGKVLASKNQLRQVFLNMISNARDAMPEGGTLSVSTMQSGQNIHVEITDTGTGILPENIDRIFDAFFTTKDSVKGVGLGLSVCFVFIREHNGDIQVKSEVGSGTTFTVILPVCE
jgi:two-component system NtrC family sensor kinase